VVKEETKDGREGMQRETVVGKVVNEEIKDGSEGLKGETVVNK
jgi:hypothetical protein